MIAQARDSIGKIKVPRIEYTGGCNPLLPICQAAEVAGRTTSAKAARPLANWYGTI
jgi:hypothetical protein